MEEQVQNASNLNILALATLLLMIYLVWTLPRRFAACPLLITTCLMPLGIKFALFGLPIFVYRILLLFGGLRVLIRGEASNLKWSRLDSLFLLWALVSVMFGSMSNPSSTLFLSRLSDAYNAVGSFFFFRCVIVEFEDVLVCVRTLAFMCIPLAASMLVEKTTMFNTLSLFQDGPDLVEMRGDHVRCQGAFLHPILAGTFGASLLPLFTALWFYSCKYHRLAIAALLSATIIAVSSSSSGAVMGIAAAISGLILWTWRGYLRLLRFATVLCLIYIALVMKAPIWYLLARLSDFSGGGGWHRGWLIDQALAHFDEWWLFGTTYTAHWGPAGEVIAADPNMMDITNHYVMEGVKGGVLKMGMFITLIVVSFNKIGMALRSGSGDFPQTFFVWGIGVSLFVHCLSFVSVTYYDQLIFVWYWMLAVICNIASISMDNESLPSDIEVDKDIPIRQATF